MSIFRRMLLIASMNGSQHGWIYPVIFGTDASVFQVYDTVKNREHLFLDPGIFKRRLDLHSSITANMDTQVRAPISYTLNSNVQINATLNAIDSTEWEHPVQSNTDLYVTQVLIAKRKDQYKLEIF